MNASASFLHQALSNEELMRRAVYIEHWRGPDTINWLGAQLDVAHHSSLCINPPPFGAQCTMHAQHSLRACLLLRSCRSLACPDPQPYQPVDRRGRRRDNIAGPICQARSTSSVEEWRSGSRLASHHGMCAPNGCHNFFLTPVRLTQPTIRAVWRDVLSSDTSSSQIVLLSEEVPKAIWHDWLGCRLIDLCCPNSFRSSPLCLALRQMHNHQCFTSCHCVGPTRVPSHGA